MTTLWSVSTTTQKTHIVSTLLVFFTETKLYFSTFLYCVELTGFGFAIMNCTLCCNKIQNTKSKLLADENSYWCWSRQDVAEETIKGQILSTANVDDNEFKNLIVKPFSVRYLSNTTHYKCDYDSIWTGTWYPIDVDNTSQCMANNSLPVNVKFRANNSSFKTQNSVNSTTQMKGEKKKLSKMLYVIIKTKMILTIM